MKLTSFLACVALCVLTFMSINCGPITQTEEYVVPGPEPTTLQQSTQIHSTKGITNLPETATINFKKQPYIRYAFQQLVRVENRKSFLDFYLKARANGQKTAMVMNCSLDILKAFVANGWAPIVMIRIGSRRPIILPISYYDNQLKTVHLQHPSDLSTRRLTYQDFETAWKMDPRNRCILITPQQLSEARIQAVLAQYLPKQTYQQIEMETR